MAVDVPLTRVNWRRRLVLNPLEWLAMMAVQLWGVVVPVGLASATGGKLARWIGPHIGRSRIARQNLARAFPDRSPAEIEAILRDMWENIGRTIFEYANLAPLLPAPPQDPTASTRRSRIEGVTHLQALAQDGKAGLLMSAHYGNWELVTLAAAACGVEPLAVVYRAANNRLLNRHIRSLQARGGGGAEPIPKGQAGARRLLASLKEGAHVILLVDQKMNDGIPVPFFGQDAMTAPALAQLALRFDVPVVPVAARRLRDERGRFMARFCLEIGPPLPPPPLEESDQPEDDAAQRNRRIAAFMARVNGEIETWIRADPGQWLWIHKRWPHEPLA